MQIDLCPVIGFHVSSAAIIMQWMNV